jgi:phenylacetate-CoA ligase
MENKYWDEYWQTMPKEKIRAHQFKWIQRIIKYAYDNVAFYRQLYDKAGFKPEDIKTWDDFYYKVPMFDKPELRVDQDAAESKFALLSRSPEYGVYFWLTTGTTGAPVRELNTAIDYHPTQDAWLAAWWDAGVRHYDSVYFCFNFGSFAGFWSAYQGAERLGMATISGSGLSTEDRIRQIMLLKPTVICGTPTYFLRMLDAAERMDVDLSKSSIRVVTAGGEGGLIIPAIGKRIKEGFGAEYLIDAYGVSEMGGVGASCHVCTGDHIWEPFFHGYIVNPETQDVVTGEPAEGELIVTGLVHTLQPYIKYRTHDIVRRYEYPDHGCGWTWDWLEGGVLGRTDYMVTLRGTNMYQQAVESLIDEVSEISLNYEIHIYEERGLDRMVVKAEAKEGVPGEKYKGLGEKLSEVYRTNLRVGIDTEIVAPNTLPKFELKTKRLFDHREKK